MTEHPRSFLDHETADCREEGFFPYAHQFPAERPEKTG